MSITVTTERANDVGGCEAHFQEGVYNTDSVHQVRRIMVGFDDSNQRHELRLCEACFSELVHAAGYPGPRFVRREATT